MESHHSELIGKSVEDVFLHKSILSTAIDILTIKQKDRIIKHYFLGLTLEEIAKEEGVYYKAISSSIESGLKKIKNILKTPTKMTSPAGNK